MYFVYSTLLAGGLFLASPYWLWQALRHGKYREGFFQRLGGVPRNLRQSNQPAIWIHAVSVGEVLAISELGQAFRREFPHYRLLVSTTTDTGQKLAKLRFGAENVFYFPLDFAFSVRPWLAALRPALVVIAETEFWPNFFRLAKNAGAPIVVTNARISDRSFPGYRRWKRFIHQALRPVDLFLAQTTEDARRLAEIGAAPEKIFVSGNLKYDVPRPPELPIFRQLQICLRDSDARPVLVCGSTVQGEEEILLNTFKDVLRCYPHAVMLLVPRHPERFADVERILQESQLQFLRRSQWNGEPLSGGVLLIDTVGELAALYGLADLAFVGGSLVPRGGHNIIEPAQHGVAILVGEHTENFRDIIQLFKSGNAVRVVSPENLTTTILHLLDNDLERAELGRGAADTLRSQQGATEFTMARIHNLLVPSREVRRA